MRVWAPRHLRRQRVSRHLPRGPARHGRARPWNAGDGRGRAASLPCRAKLPGAGPDRQRVRPARARFRVSAGRSAGPHDGGTSRKAGAPRGSGGRAQSTSRHPRNMSRKANGRLLAGFRRALEEQRLNMVYQPKVAVREGNLTRVEALVRWDDPELGPIEPSRFVPLAEEHGLIDDLTHWGLRTILRQWVEWSDEGIDANIAFNISALSLQHLDFPDLVERMCRGLDVPCDRLVLELTEGATQPLVKLMDTLTRFRIKGIGLAIDDFGTGYSSLMQLRQLPFTEVKIDQAFVADVTRSSDCRLIIQAITELAHGLGLTATAEGVETIEQLRIVRELGCDLVQGYLISHPLEPAALKPWKAKFRRTWPALIAEEPLALWGNFEPDSLSERQI